MIKSIAVLSLVAVSMFSIGCAEDSDAEVKTDGYKVHRLAQGMKIDGNWDKPEWQGAAPIYPSSIDRVQAGHSTCCSTGVRGRGPLCEARPGYRH